MWDCHFIIHLFQGIFKIITIKIKRTSMINWKKLKCNKRKLNVKVKKNWLKMSVSSRTPYTCLQTLYTTMPGKGRKWLSTDKWQQDCTEKLARMTSLDLQPISIVEGKGFKDFVGCLQPSYNMPDQHVLQNNVKPELYKTMKSDIQQKLNVIESFAITLDHWTSTGQDAYMDSWLWNGFLTMEWIPDYEEKLVAIYTVTDNAANVKAAMRRLIPEKFKSLYCFAHTLQLVVNSAVEAFPELGGVIKKAKAVCQSLSQKCQGFS